MQQSYFSFAMDRSITLAGFVILKLIRSRLAPHLDLVTGEKAYFQAIQFLKAVSLQPGDIYVRTAHIMTDLWGSNRVFRKKDGQIESLGLRLRSRLGMSVSYDMFWYWREEFEHMQNPYNGEETTVPSTEATRPNSPRENTRHSIDTPMLTSISAYAGPQHRQLPGPPPTTSSTQIPLTKFDPNLLSMQPDPAMMSFDGWDGSDYNVPPMMEQFPDYDWAASFDFPNNQFSTVPLGTIGPSIMPGSVDTMGYTFG